MFGTQKRESQWGNFQTGLKGALRHKYTGMVQGWPKPNGHAEKLQKPRMEGNDAMKIISGFILDMHWEAAEERWARLNLFFKERKFLW